jgi:flagellar protein FlgJ
MESAGAVDFKQVLQPEGTKTVGGSPKSSERMAREEELKKACADFESIFIYNMLQKMRGSVPKSGLLKEMEGKSTYNSIVDQKVSENIAASGGMGLQKMLFDQIIATDKNFDGGN